MLIMTEGLRQIYQDNKEHELSMDYKIMMGQNHWEQLTVKRQGHIITLERKACVETNFFLYVTFTQVSLLLAQAGLADASISSPLLAQALRE